MPKTTSEGLIVENLSKSYGNRNLWTDLSFTVPVRTTLALTGRSGSGKSTLLNCLGMLDTPDTGNVLLNGERLTRNSRRQARLLRRNDIGYLFQNYALIDAASVQQNLAVVRNPKRKISEVLHVCGLAGREREHIYRLSGGEQQRVALARVLLKRPGLVLADEPTGALDDANTAIVVEQLQKLAAEGSCVVIATHNGDVAQACDDVLNLDEHQRHAAD